MVMLSTCVEGFLLAKSAAGRSHYTLRNYRKELARYLEYLGDRPAESIINRDSELYLQWLKEQFRVTAVSNNVVLDEPRKLSGKSVKNAWLVLSAFWHWYAEEFNAPCPFRVKPIKYNPKPVLPLTKEEIEALLKAVDSSYGSNMTPFLRHTRKRDKAVILLLLDTGIRCGELCDITFNDVDFDKQRIIIRAGKGDKSRVVYFSKITFQALWKYLIERYPDGKYDPKDALFHGRLDYPMTRFGVVQLMKRLGKRTGIKLHPHKFRHTFAIEFLRNGGNVLELQDLLGHTDLRMVKVYAHMAQVDLEAASKRSSPVDNWKLKI